MNMISTGAFLNEMDASNKQPSVAEKFAAVWEKKNAKAARAGGVSLMALSLAACGSSSSTTTSTTTTTDSTTTTTPTSSSGQTYNLTAGTTGDDLVGTAGADTFEAATTARLTDADSLNGGAGTDTLNAYLNSATAHDDASIVDIEVLNFTLTANSTMKGEMISGATDVNVSGGYVLTYSKAETETFNVSGASTGLTVTSSAGTDGSADAITVELGAGKLGTLTLGDASGVDYETINLVVEGDGSATITEANTANFNTSGESIVVTGTGDYELKITDAALGGNTTETSAKKSVIDGSGHTGKLTLDLGALETEHVNTNKFSGVDVIEMTTDDTGSDDNKLIDVASGTEVVIYGTESTNNEVTIDPNGTATDDTLTVTLNDATKGTSVALTKLTIDGFETTTINSTGTDSATVVVKNSIATVAGTVNDSHLIISGDKKFTVGTAVESTFTNIDITNTAGSDLTLANSSTVDYDGGAGADRVEVSAVAQLTTGDSFAGGDGTDTFAIGAEVGTDLSAAQRAMITGFEVLEYDGAQDLTGEDDTVTVDLTKLTGINTLFINGALKTDSNDLLKVVAESGFTYRTDTAPTGAAAAELIFDIKNAANAGTNDTVTFSSEIDASGAGSTIGGFTIDNVENVVLEVKGVFQSSDVQTISDIDGAQLKNITIKSTAGNDTDGNAKVAESLTITTVESTLVETVNAGDYTGTLDVTGLASKLISTGATLTGGTGVNKFTGGDGADVITGGKAADVLKGGSGNDQITGGASGDTIEGEGGADTLTGGSGDDEFDFAANASTEAAMDKITDYQANAADADNDKLDLVGTTVESDITLANAIDVKAATTDTDTSVTAYVTNGIIKLGGTQSGNVNTLAEWIDVAELVATSDTANNAAATYSTVAFEFDGNTYVLQETSAQGGDTEATTAVIELTGVTGITAVDTSAATSTILIA